MMERAPLIVSMFPPRFPAARTALGESGTDPEIVISAGVSKKESKEELVGMSMTQWGKRGLTSILAPAVISVKLTMRSILLIGLPDFTCIVRVYLSCCRSGNEALIGLDEDKWFIAYCKMSF